MSAAAVLLVTAGAAAQTPVPAAPVLTQNAIALSTADDRTLLAVAEPQPVFTASPSPDSGLPDAPSSTASASDSAQPDASTLDLQDAGQPGPRMPRAASPSDITVLPGQVAPRQTVRDKLVGSVRDSVSPFSLAGELISAGYSHVTNGSPNFGTNSTAFAQRFGASVARGTSQNLFYEGAMAAILHEDPRYYEMGDSKPFFKRVVYAATRPIITRTDSGKTTPNFALLSGYLGAAALTKVYYPQINQGFNQTLQTYGGSIGGAAIGYVVSEFLSDALQIVHLKKGE